jgi:hypothetical protein
MSFTERISSVGKDSNHQETHRNDGWFLHEPARTAWQQLSECLISAYQQCLRGVQPHLEEAERARIAQETVEITLQGNAAALALLEGIPEAPGNGLTLHREYPWNEISRAYAAAFTAAGMVALQTLTWSPRMVALAAELARLALRAAETLNHGVGLLLGTRLSGSIVQVCAYVGTLEGQADTVLRGYLAAPAEGYGYGSAQGITNTSSAERQVLLALEAMTDRCEDIADVLLAAAHDCLTGLPPTRQTAKAEAQEGHEQ